MGWASAQGCSPTFAILESATAAAFAVAAAAAWVAAGGQHRDNNISPPLRGRGDEWIETCAEHEWRDENCVNPMTPPLASLRRSFADQLLGAVRVIAEPRVTNRVDCSHRVGMWPKKGKTARGFNTDVRLSVLEPGPVPGIGLSL
jgi:hypothetical protein